MSLINYDINFINQQGNAINIRITDYANFIPNDYNDTTIIELTGIAPTLEVETFNTNENKFTPIIGQRVKIQFKSTNQVNFQTFATGEDDRFFVRITSGIQFIFSGFLLMEENEQLYMPSGQAVTLFASDGLARLKNIELSNFSGVRPTGKQKLIDIIAWCIRKVEGRYPEWNATIYDQIYIYVNIFESNQSSVNNCPFNQTYVDCLTFEKRLGEYDDCYTVLSKILSSFGCRMMQHNNCWHIVRIDEYKGDLMYRARYSIGGVFQTRDLGVSIDKEINDNIRFVNGTTIQRLQRPSKDAVINMNYDFPREMPLNSGFIHGEFIDDYFITIPVYSTFQFDNWTLKRGFGSSEGTPNCEVFIKREYDTYGTEITRRLQFTVPDSHTPAPLTNYVKSMPIKARAGDKLDFSVEASADHDINIGGTGYSVKIALISLVAENGNIYYWYENPDDDKEKRWVNTNDTDLAVLTYQFSWRWDFEASAANDDMTLPRSFGGDTKSFPVDGNIYIHLFAANQISTNLDNFEMRFQDLRIEYKAQINGSYDIKGESHSMSHSAKTYYTKTEEEVYLFDAQQENIKGALFYKNGDNFYLTRNWFDQAMGVYDLNSLPDFSYPLLYWQTYYLWNQTRLNNSLISATLHGVDVSNGYVSMLHKFKINGAHAISPLTEKSFIMLSLRQDWHSCQWSATLSEIDYLNDRRSIDNYRLKYTY